MSTKLIRLFASLVVVLGAVFKPTDISVAMGFSVNSTNDVVDANPGDGVCDTGAGECTLRAAIQEANALAGNDAISLPSGTYYLTIAGNNDDAAATGDLDITSNLVINGTGDVIIDGNGGVISDRVFHVTGAFTVNMTRVTIRGGNPGFSDGGGIFVAGGAALTLTESTVVNNTTSANGGGVRTDGEARLTLTNSTISNNSASSGVGGGIFSAGVLTVTNSTINGNTAFDGGGIYNFPSFTATLKNTIVANSPAGGNCSGTVTDGGGNISWPDATCPGLNADPLLGSMANNGGPTETHALLPGSPAIDTAVDANCPATDQRGVTRPQGTRCDIGAFELENQIISPVNDGFVNAKSITALPFSDSLDNSNASTELGEPQYCFYSPNTIWYLFTPATNAMVRADMAGSSFGDTIFNIYQSTGSGLGGLSFMQCGYFGNSATFSVQAGTTYYIQAGSIYGSSGSLQLNLQEIPRPINDDFANPISFNALPFTQVFDTAAATFESGEPSSCGYPSPPYKTIWFAFTASNDGSVSASIPSSNFAPFLAVYQGTSLDGLTQLGCGQYTNKVTFRAVQGQTYYFQVGGYYGEGGLGTFLLEIAPLPQVNFYFYPGDPSMYDTIQFCTSSYDPGQVGFQSFMWDFGDGVTSTSGCSTHQYSADGDYTVQHTVTTFDGRTALISQIVHVRTHDVAIAKINAPQSANTNQTRTITVSVKSKNYAETVRIDLYRSVPGGWEYVGSVTQLVPARSSNRTSTFNFNYTFTNSDASIGKVTFRAVASIVDARDSYPSDNEAISSPPTRIAR